MCYRWLFVVSALIAAPLGALTTPFTTHWGDMRAKYMWNATPHNWEILDLRYRGRPPRCASAQRGNSLIDALYEVSTPMHPKYGYGAYLSRKQVAQRRDKLELVDS
ncbi:hypothetical protein EDB89DRAFT_1905289 [Lactarius sanguifluus]|nr:hypothetical protein EDB89DRAFT_1905289 [Lactarius sanguifluus]